MGMCHEYPILGFHGKCQSLRVGWEMWVEVQNRGHAESKWRSCYLMDDALRDYADGIVATYR